MYIKKLEIENFRGIKKMSYIFKKGVNCLIGPGDSTKSTILKAINMVLTPNRSIYIADSDFYNMNVDNEINIKATIGDISQELLNEDKFGLYISKLANKDEDDEPSDNDEIFLKLQLTVSKYYELKWEIVNNRNMKKTIGPNDRQKIKIGFIGEKFDKDFNLGRNSNLTNHYDNPDEMKNIILDIYRSINNTQLESNENIEKLILQLKNVEKEYGINLHNNLNIKLNIRNDFSTSDLEIFNDKIPISLNGTGTKRLFSTSLNVSTINSNSIVLIDEIEYGLEPYRLMKLLRVLRKNKKDSQVIITSHSIVTMSQLDAEELVVCRSNNGTTKCVCATKDMQNLLRRVPEAILSYRVLLVEGRTEYGIIEELNYWWSEDGETMEYYGTTKVDGGSDSTACKYAKQLKALGYEVAVLLDSDNRDVDNQVDKIEQLGVKVIRWNDNLATEERVLMDLPNNRVEELVELLKSTNNVRNIKDKIGIEFFDNNDKLIFDKLDNENRKRIGKTIKEEKWLKNIDQGKNVGAIIWKSELAKEIENTDLSNKIKEVRSWCYGC